MYYLLQTSANLLLPTCVLYYICVYEFNGSFSILLLKSLQLSVSFSVALDLFSDRFPLPLEVSGCFENIFY